MKTTFAPEPVVLLFIEAIKNALNIQLGLRSNVVKMQLPPNLSHLSNQTVVLEFSRDNIVGRLRFLVDEKTAAILYIKMTGEAPPKNNEDCWSALLELMNIIYASARQKINQLGYDFQPVIPHLAPFDKLKMNTSLVSADFKIGQILTEITFENAANL